MCFPFARLGYSHEQVARRGGGSQRGAARATSAFCFPWPLRLDRLTSPSLVHAHCYLNFKIDVFILYCCQTKEYKFNLKNYHLAVRWVRTPAAEGQSRVLCSTRHKPEADFPWIFHPSWSLWERTCSRAHPDCGQIRFFTLVEKRSRFACRLSAGRPYPVSKAAREPQQASPPFQISSPGWSPSHTSDPLSDFSFYCTCFTSSQRKSVSKGGCDWIGSICVIRKTSWSSASEL